MDLIGNGLRGEYYDTDNLTNLRFTRTDSTVNFNWGMGSPGAAIASDTFSVRWTGQVQPTTSGNYTFFVPADDGVRLWVNGQLLINDWEDRGVVIERSGTISLTGQQRYDIRLEYFEHDGQASAQLLWSAPNQPKQVIPQSQLYSTPLGDTTPPTASLSAPDILTEGGTTYQFTVTYSDNTAMNVATLNGSDILVTGANGFNQMAALVSVNNSSNGTPRTATYQITAPGGSWTVDDNGRYTLALQANQVSDTSGNFMPASTLGSFLVNLPTSTGTENIVFPADAGVINVKTQFGAKGDGVTDDTAAIQAALNAYPNGGRIIYLPNGVYLVSDRLSWAAGTPGTGNDYKNIILQGQSQQGTILKLKDSAPGYTNPSAPKSVIYTGPKPAQRFRNSIRNLTVDTGVGNTGAIAIQFNASNQGTVRDVTIRSRDRQGINGLDMSFTDEIGPLLVKNVTVQGFQYGIRSGFNVNSQTLENITLENQSVYGFYNAGQVVNIRGLTSRNAVTAVYNAGGRMTLIDSTLTGTGAAASRPAIRSDFPLDLLARNIRTSGYQAAIQNANTTQIGPNITEFVGGGVTSLFTSPARTLNLPIRETPDVPWDDPITTPWANVVSFGAIPNDGRDDTAAIQAAIDSGRTTVYFPNGSYDLRGTVLVRNNVRRVIGTEAHVVVGSESNPTNPGFRLVNGTSPVVVFERFSSGYYANPTFENASARTMVIRHALNVSGNMTGSGDVFIEDVVSNPVSSWTFNRQNIWARQFNVENQGTHIRNNGGNLWILGLKTERGGTLIDTRAGGKTELLGGFAYTTTAAPNGLQNDPMFINHESSISISMAEINYGGGPNYTTYVRETRNGVTRNLSRNSLPNYMGSGKQIPLYVGYQG
ncbi:MAG TPA: endopolygalacturonase [Cyanobacteria bacterium UBA11372]|nr:endopolygalacturonase [Cyanobacteria bacterium UBA11372]